MSMTIYQFLDQIVKKDVQKITELNAYAGAGLMAGGIEFLGACLDAHPISVEGESAARFCNALNKLFPAAYHQFSRVAPFRRHEKPAHDLYTALRCGMAHVMRPQGVFFTAGIQDAASAGLAHLQVITRGGKTGPLIIVEKFSSDFVAAVTKLEKDLQAAGLPAKLQGNIIEVWNS